MPKTKPQVTRAKSRKAGADAIQEESPLYRVNGTHAPVRFRFIGLFCGIGGFRIAFERAGCQCVFSCEWDSAYSAMIDLVRTIPE